MRIDGKAIASNIFEDLKKRVVKLKRKHIVPHLAIILVGNDPASKAYVAQKELRAKEIGAKATVLNYEARIKNQELLETIKKLNADSAIHGIIVQRPLPEHIDPKAINNAVDPRKDVDGFHPKMKFTPPIAEAVLEILKNVYSSSEVRSTKSRSKRQKVTNSSRFANAHSNNKNNLHLKNWLQSKNIVVIGKGETGGGPILTMLRKLGIKPQVIDSKTKNPHVLTKNADIIISAVGKPNVLQANSLKKGVILISIGIHRGKDGKLHADFEEENVKNTASFYTPVPGGVGPVNVAMLLQNLIQIAESYGKLRG